MVRDWLFGIAATLATVGLSRIAFLLFFRRPAPACVVGLELSEGERLHERAMHLAAHFDGIPTTDDMPFRRTLARVAYHVDGTEYRRDIALIRHSGDRPDMSPVVWYDPRDPERVTGMGPSLAVLLIIVAGGIAILGWHCAV